MSRSLKKLEPEFRELLDKAIEIAELEGLYMVPYETERTVFDQAILWRQSRSSYTVRNRIAWLKQQGADFLAKSIEDVGPQSGPWATNALPGMSWHQWGLACDLYWDRNGPAKGGVEWNDLSGYKRFGKIAEELGLTSGYFWRSKDAVHVQLPEESRPRYALSKINESMLERYG